MRGFYARRVLPLCIEYGMRARLFRTLRGELLAGAQGRVLELGVGTGHNLPHYPHHGVTHLIGVEPHAGMLARARARQADAPFPATLVLAEAERLPLADASVDCVVCTWTLCSVPAVEAALREVRRVLRPGGSFRFVEHGLSDIAGVQRWQHRLTPLQKRLAGGCHLDRPVAALVQAAGFALEEDERFSLGWPRVMTYHYRGVARPAGPDGAAAHGPLRPPQEV